MLCTILSSNGSGGWKKSVIMLFPMFAFNPSTLSIVIDDTAVSGANGSIAPTGAKLSNDKAASVAGGERELLVDGEG